MRQKILFLGLLFTAFQQLSPIHATETTDTAPSFYMWKYVAKTDLNPTPYLLPVNHRLQKVMRSIFKSPAIIHNTTTLSEAGFIPFSIRKNQMHVLKHAAAPGYLFKLFTTSFSSQQPYNFALSKLVQRCVGAAYLRNLITQNNLRNFIVPTKWIYQIPAKNKMAAQYVLIVQDMQLTTRDETSAAWKRASKTQVKELNLILSHGYPSLAIVSNIPYTRNKKFACIDTEYPRRRFKLTRIKNNIPKKFGKYWDKLTKANRKLRKM